MRRLAAWREAGGIEAGPLFRRIHRGDHVEASVITVPAARSIIQARPLPGSRVAFPATACGWARRSPSPSPAPGWSSCSRLAGGTAPRCPRTTRAASSPYGAPSPAYATARARARLERRGWPRCRSWSEARRRRRATYPRSTGAATETRRTPHCRQRPRPAKAPRERSRRLDATAPASMVGASTGRSRRPGSPAPPHR